MRVLVAGASGFIGRRLCTGLIEKGHEVRAMTRHPERYRRRCRPGWPVRADVDRPETLYPALEGCQIAYYLVHSLDRPDFVRRDATAAREFGLAAARAGVRRIIYLGGLGDEADDLSDHLRSRQEVETLLQAGGVPVTALRAGIVIGHGGASWELIRNLVERIPALAVPRWAFTRTQPIALADAVRYLVGVLELDPGLDDRDPHVYEIGGAEVLRYVDVLSRVSAIEGRPTLIVPVPVPNRRLAGLVAGQTLPLITGVDGRVVRALLESLRNEVVVRDGQIRSLIPFEPMDYDAAVLAALGERARAKRAG